jgi:hypothetical protein
MLPWDVWGAIPKADETLNHDQVAFFDRLAELTRSLDSSSTQLRQLYENDDRLSEPTVVFNGVLNCSETI